MKTKMYILIKFYSIVVSEGMVCTYKRFKKKSQVIIYLNLCSHCPFSFLPKADCCFPLLRARYYLQGGTKLMDGWKKSYFFLVFMITFFFSCFTKIFDIFFRYVVSDLNLGHTQIFFLRSN